MLEHRILCWLSACLLLWRHHGQHRSGSLCLMLLVCQQQGLRCRSRPLLGWCLLWSCCRLALRSVDQRQG